MRLVAYLKNAWFMISRNKMRSFLTMLGIIIGIMSLIIILSVGAGAQSLILNQVKSMGANLIGVLPGKSDDQGPPVSVFGVVVTTLTAEDGLAILQGGNSAIKAVSGYVRGAETITWEENKIDTTFVGVNASYLDVEDTALARGRFFSAEEEAAFSPVAVLGSAVAVDLFGEQNPVGQRIKIKRTNFTIIGVMRERGVSGFQNQDEQIFVPLPVAQKLLLGIRHVSFMRIKVDAAESVPTAIQHVKTVLRERHDITNPENDDFSVRSTNQGLETLSGITNALRFFLAAIAAIALLVGGIGIMNIMLAAVEERTREIGLRKAVGATNREIIRQFLAETTLITLVGGLAGLVLGIVISAVVAAVAKQLGYQWDLVISPLSVMVSCLVSIGIGLVFGVTPARRASRLDPITALRYE